MIVSANCEDNHIYVVRDNFRYMASDKVCDDNELNIINSHLFIGVVTDSKISLLVTTR